MPTYDQEDRFRAEYRRLSAADKAAFNAAVRKFVDDLRAGRFRKGLRVKRYQSVPGAWELTWAADGRALFRYGDQVRPGHVHIIWVRIGGHEIFDDA